MVKNAYVPSCKNCIYYEIKYKCKKFGIKDIITNEIEYEDARDCRKREQQCGPDGIYFERDPFPFLKDIKYNLNRTLKSFTEFPLEFSLLTTQLGILSALVIGYCFKR